MSGFSITPGPLADEYDRACRRLDEAGVADALWARRLTLWPGGPGVHDHIANRLGWLDAIDTVMPHLPRLRACAAAVRDEGFTHVVLLGMGGSSLAPEVLRQVVGVAAGFPRFRMLDSVDPDAVRAAMDHAATSLFVFASKSGSTIEPNALAAEARRRVLAAGLSWSTRVIAITDEGTALHRRASAERYRDVFINPSDIGGRYSALSLFGLLPAALMGVDLDAFLAAARAMAAACRTEPAAANPGLALGALMAAGVAARRDKLVVLLPERLRALGLWIEQLVAESTGKEGTGVVPIVGEPDRFAEGHDRLAVSYGTPADLPTMTIELERPDAIGAEFFRWEFATAAAGALLGVNPFDEPNVTQAKEATRAILDRHAGGAPLLRREPQAVVHGARLTLSHQADEALAGRPATDFLSLLQPGDYFALLAYLPPDDPAWATVLDEFRLAVAEATRCATMGGYGPRYLHSTGQLHKGGGNNGVFLIVTTSGVEDLPVPGERFSFGVLELAQALGDFTSLEDAGRRVLHVHLQSRDQNVFRDVTITLLHSV